MKFLADTNIILPLEPTSPDDVEPLTEVLTELARLSTTLGHRLYLHPASRLDISKDTNDTRRQLRQTLLQKYPFLPEPPQPDERMRTALGTPGTHTNDWIDFQLLAALRGEAVDYLVTEDRKLFNKARLIGVADRVLRAVEALALLRDLTEKPTVAPPHVRRAPAHALPTYDPILDSLRLDYGLTFDGWLSKCKREHRDAYIVDGDGTGLAAFAIVKPEHKPPGALTGKVLKLCTFKVAERFNGFRYGELLLKAVFDYAQENAYDSMFVTVFERHTYLLNLLTDHGFMIQKDLTDIGELILAKQLRPMPEDEKLYEPLDYHIRFGPRYFRADVPWYIVPIQPVYASALFPETTPQGSLFGGWQPYGNSIRKAYLCHSPTRTMGPGDVALFYRSGDQPGIIAAGIVEDTLVSSDPTRIARFVARRTVYSLAEINKMIERPVLAIRFRQAKLIRPPIPPYEAKEAGAVKQAPQSVTRVRKEGLPWLRAKIVQ